MTNKTKSMVACAGIFLLSTLALSFRQVTYAQSEAATATNNLATVSLNLDTTFLDPNEGNSVIRAFVATGSKSVNCLTSMNEILTDITPTSITVFCGERQPVAFGNVPGILVSVFFTQPPPSDFTMSLTLYQQGAKKYAPPVLCTADQGC